jgi:hypothetical protein
MNCLRVDLQEDEKKYLQVIEHYYIPNYNIVVCQVLITR